MKHSAILKKLGTLNVGQRTYNYIRDFLTNRTVIISLDGHSLEDVKIGSTGTPQGLVLSPILFNIAMLDLPKVLNEGDGLHHTLYADDLTLWMNRASDGHIEQTLQRAIDATEEYLKPIGLTLSAEKSELLIMHTQSRGAAREPVHAIELKVNGNAIQKVENIQVLGLRIQANGKNSETIQILDRSTCQTCRLLKRVSSKRAGMKEENLLRLVQSFIVSRIIYVAPYLKLTQIEKNKIDCILRKGIKTALGLPPSTSTTKLMNMGLSNIIDELIEAATVSQHQRLLRSRTGRNIMQTLGYEPRELSKQTDKVPTKVRNRLRIAPLPNHMHATHDEGRRKDRVQRLNKKLHGNPEVIYTNAAEYVTRKGCVAATVCGDGTKTSCCSVEGGDATEAQKVAIALALGQEKA